MIEAMLNRGLTKITFRYTLRKMSLKKKLIDVKPREVSGARSANRFDFQKSWGLCHLLHLHKTKKDYVIVFDYHDDILVLDSSDNPTKIDFFQIKTKENGLWSKKKLLHRKKGKNGKTLSILGKLVDNKLNFPDHTNSLNLVSNQMYSLSVKGTGQQTSLCLSDVDAKELDEILDSLQKEHSLTGKLDCANQTFLMMTPLSLGEHSTHAMGKLAEFLNEVYPNQKIHLNAAYQSLCDEIRRRSTAESAPSDYVRLCQDRGIPKKDFQALINDIRPDSQFRDSLSSAIAQLRSEKENHLEIEGIRKACDRFEVDRMDKTNVVLTRGRKLISKAIAQLKADKAMPATLVGSVNAIVEKVSGETKQIVASQSGEYLRAMIVMGLYGF